MMSGTELLVALRTLGLSQKEFAERIGYRPETISRYVRDREPIPTIVELAVSGLGHCAQLSEGGEI